MGAVAHLARPLLEPAGQVRRSALGGDRVAGEGLGGLAGAADHDPPARHERRERVVRQDDYRVVSMDNSKLLRRDRLDRVPEHVGVLETDVREQHDARAQHVRRVVAAAEPGLDDGDVDAGGGERRQRRRRDRLELRRAEPLGVRPDARSAASRSAGRPSTLIRSLQERT